MRSCFSRSIVTAALALAPLPLQAQGGTGPGMRGRDPGERRGEMRRDEGRGGPRGIGERGLRRMPVRGVSPEQRSRLVTVLRARRVGSLRNVRFAVRIGAFVPAGVFLSPLPPEFLSFAPDYEGYEYIVIDDQIVILDPETRSIVEIIS